MTKSIPEGLRKFLSRHEQIGNKDLFVFDGIVSQAEMEECYLALSRIEYLLNDVDSKETQYSKHWKAEFDVQEVPRILFWGRILQVALQVFPEEALVLNRVHSNLHLYGDLQFPHVDSKDGVTLLYYANPVWNENWMGETIFYSDDREPYLVVAPRPGRVIVFRGNILHRAGVPSRECFEPRVSLAFKFGQLEE